MRAAVFQLVGLAIVTAVLYRTVRDMLHRAEGRGRLGKWLAAVQIGVMAPLVAVFVYGMIFFSDGPIRPCETGFCGKGGTVRTAADYHDFMVWEHTMLVTWGIGLPIHFGLWWITKR
jgi:hypothetical protein